MKSISFRYKALAAAFLLLFSASYQQLYYNLLLIALLLIILKIEKIRLFRFPGQGWFFGSFLLLMFMMQSINGYGTILFELPFGFFVSEEGLRAAILFVSGVLLVFLLCATAVYTTPPDSFYHYLKRLENKRGFFGQMLFRFGRILMVVMHLIPTAFSGGKSLMQEKATELSGKRLSDRLQILSETIFRFFQELLIGSEKEYFRLKAEPAQVNPPAVLPHWGQFVLLMLLFGIHVLLMRGLIV